MKSRTLCACLIAMLLISHVAFGEILEAYDYDGNCGGNEESSSPVVSVDGSDNYDNKWGSGWEFTYTTVTANCNWNYDVYAYAEGVLILYDNDWCGATAVGDADGNCKFDSHDNYATISLSDSGTGGRRVPDSDLDDDYPGGVYKNGWGLFNAYQGVYVSHDALAIASVPESGSCSAYAHGCAHAIGGMN